MPKDRSKLLVFAALAILILTLASGAFSFDGMALVFDSSRFHLHGHRNGLAKIFWIGLAVWYFTRGGCCGRRRCRDRHDDEDVSDTDVETEAKS